MGLWGSAFARVVVYAALFLDRGLVALGMKEGLLPEPLKEGLLPEGGFAA